jgi:hypothetical protein
MLKTPFLVVKPPHVYPPHYHQLTQHIPTAFLVESQFSMDKSCQIPMLNLVGGFNHLEKYESQWEG